MIPDVERLAVWAAWASVLAINAFIVLVTLLG
jgi:hypothetical protein